MSFSIYPNYLQNLNHRTLSRMTITSTEFHHPSRHGIRLISLILALHEKYNKSDELCGKVEWDNEINSICYLMIRNGIDLFLEDLSVFLL